MQFIQTTLCYRWESVITSQRLSNVTPGHTVRTWKSGCLTPKLFRSSSMCIWIGPPHGLKQAWDPSAPTPRGSWPPASAAGHFLQLLWRSRAGAYIQGVSFFSFPTGSGLWGPLDPRSQSWVYTQKFLLIWLCLCENFQMRLIHFLSLLFFSYPMKRYQLLHT